MGSFTQISSISSPPRRGVGPYGPEAGVIGARDTLTTSMPALNWDLYIEAPRCDHPAIGGTVRFFLTPNPVSPTLDPSKSEFLSLHR